MQFYKHIFKKPGTTDLVHWKSISFLRYYTTRFGAIKPRKYTGISVKQQKMVRQAIMRARELGLMPYIK